QCNVHRDVLGFRVRPCPVDRLLHHVRYLNDGGGLEALVVLDLGEVDDLLHQVNQPGGLLLNLPAETVHRLRVIGIVRHGLGQQRNRPDGGLQLVGHVGHKVATYSLDAVELRLVVAQHQHIALTQRGNTRVKEAAGVFIRVVLKDGVDVRVNTTSRHPGRCLLQLRGSKSWSVDQPQSGGRGGGLSHLPVRVNDDGGAGKCSQDLVHPCWQPLVRILLDDLAATSHRPKYETEQNT